MAEGDETAEGPRVPDHDLSDRDRAILDFERRGGKRGGSKEQAIRDQLGLSSARYYQVLGRIIDSPAALIYDPMLVRRLQRLRQARLEERANRLRTER
jgi:hypothetical protein